MTVPFAACACKDGTYKCAFSDSCLLPVCLFKNWDSLLGTTCADAKTEILKEYPGMNVICATEKPIVNDDNFNTNRIYVVVDGNQVVVASPTVG
jgi:Potato inhibitor I family